MRRQGLRRQPVCSHTEILTATYRPDTLSSPVKTTCRKLISVVGEIQGRALHQVFRLFSVGVLATLPEKQETFRLREDGTL